MIYLPELYYFFDQKDFPAEKAVLVTAKKISEWSTYYKAKLLFPVKGVRETERQGRLPQETKEKQQFITDLITWIMSNSERKELFALFLDDTEIGQRKDMPNKFDHHDDTCCWAMNLIEQQFQELKNIWKDDGLPEDMFYNEAEAIRITKPHGLIARFFARLGFSFENSVIYSPRRWQEKNKENLPH